MAALGVTGLCSVMTPAVASVFDFGASAEKPNVVIIYMDDMGWGDITSYNRDSKINTPNIDQIALEGMRFTDAHTPSSVCTPSRYGLITGEYGWRSDLKKGVTYDDPLIIPEGKSTIASMLKREGYSTAAIGKWHLGLGKGKYGKDKTDFNNITRGVNDVGFDYWYGISASLDIAPYGYIENDKLVEPLSEHINASDFARNGGVGFWREGDISPSFNHKETLPHIVDKAEQYLEGAAKKKEPFLLYLPFTSPHTPWIPSDEFRGKTSVGPYGDFIYQIDHHVGEINNKLKELGLDENTLLIVSSDNGSHWNPEDIKRWNHRANGPWRGMKADIYEGGHRVPLIVKLPKTIPAGTVSDENVSMVDMYATVADLIDVELKDDEALDSYSILPAMTQKIGTSAIREATVYHSYRGMFAIQKGKWKLIEGKGSGGFWDKDGTASYYPDGQLYNLSSDPKEENNLYNQYPEVVSELQSLLNQYREEGHSRPLK